MSKTIKIILVSVLALALISIIFFYLNYNTATTKAKNNDASDDNIGVMVHTDYPYRTTEQMVEESTLVTYATVISQSEPFAVSTTNGGDPSNFTDYTIAPEQIYRGNAEMESNIIVRIKGGIVGNVYVEYNDDPNLKVGKQYMLFLYQPGVGGGNNTKEDYYYIVGGRQGVIYSNDSDNNPATLNDLTSDVGDTVDPKTLIDTIYAVNEASPVEAIDMKNKFYTNLQSQLDEGKITQNEYDALIEESKIYAQVIE